MSVKFRCDRDLYDIDMGQSLGHVEGPTQSLQMVLLGIALQAEAVLVAIASDLLLLGSSLKWTQRQIDERKASKGVGPLTGASQRDTCARDATVLNQERALSSI